MGIEDFLSVMLSGAGGAMGGYVGHKQAEQKQADDIALAKTKGQASLNKSVLSSIAGAAAKQAMKSGKAIDFGDLAMDDDNMVLTMIQKIFGPGGMQTGATAGINPNGGGRFNTAPASSTGGGKAPTHRFNPATGKLEPL